MSKAKVRGEAADKVVVDEVQDIEPEEKKAVEEGFADAPETEVADEAIDLQERKEKLIDGLIGSAEEKLDTKLDAERVETVVQEDPNKKSPATEANFDRGGAAIAGPFARRRVRAVTEKKKPATPDNPRRGVQRIWEDRPINNVG